MITKKVVIIQRRLSQYRKPFFERLKNKLNEEDVDLVLIYGQPSKTEILKGDNVDIAWGRKINNRKFKIFGNTFIWQPCLKYIIKSDLIIVEQASKLILNYVLFFLQPFIKGKLCFWGHGRNFQLHRKNKWSEKIKMILSRNVFWWFAYNDLSATVVESFGFDKSKITSVQNTLDNEKSISTFNSLDQSADEEFKKSMSIAGNNVCLFAGSIYPEKRIKFLIESCELIKARIPDFEMVFMGAGTEAPLVEEASEKHDWMHYVGVKFGTEKVPFFRVSKLLLMPGLVGLAIIDAFDFETPIVTTNINYHSPEIGYLESGINGIIVNEFDDKSKYAEVVSETLSDSTIYENLVKGCRIAKNRYTIMEMVDRFSNGIITALHYSG